MWLAFELGQGIRGSSFVCMYGRAKRVLRHMRCHVACERSVQSELSSDDVSLYRFMLLMIGRRTKGDRSFIKVSRDGT